MKLDIIVGLQRGDESKGKITYDLLKQRRNQYTHCMRWGGGHNAGHTIYHEGQKLITHIVPTGAILGIKSIIGPGCVLDPDLFMNELTTLYTSLIGIDPFLFVKVAKQAHIILKEHLDEDQHDSQGIGTTKRGNGPAYRDKYDRSGLRAEKALPRKYLIDIYEEFYENNPDAYILMEGAQGFYLDIDHGDYPFVTSSHTVTGGALINGFPPQSVNEIWGAAKCYETYVGSKQFQYPGRIFEDIAMAGQEYGATTGRLRQVDYLHLDELIKAIRMNGVTHLVVSKIDILRQVKTWNMRRTYPDGDFYCIQLDSEDEFIAYLIRDLTEQCPSLKELYLSDSPYKIGEDKITLRR